jgi:hypothetical protein
MRDPTEPVEVELLAPWYYHALRRAAVLAVRFGLLTPHLATRILRRCLRLRIDGVPI